MMTTKKNHLSRATLFFYSLPMLGGGLVNMLLNNYFMKYSTDVLLIGPATIGFLFFILRIWDAINDPIIGILSDRTQSKIGRRKIWIGASLLPLVGSFLLLWFVPLELSETSKVIWTGACMFILFTALTGLYVPHYALGSELSSDYYSKNRIYGIRAILENCGNFLGVFVIYLLTSHSTHKEIIIISTGALTIIATLLFHFNIKEPNLVISENNINNKDYEQQNNSAFNGLRQVLRNRPTMIIFMGGFFSQMGATLILALALYHSQYIMKDSNLGPAIIGIFLISATVSIPIWIWIGKKFEKKTLWIGAMFCLTVGFSSIFFMNNENRIVLLILSGFLGFIASINLIIHPSLVADTIDYGQWRNKTRNEGTYFSLFTFINKSAMALANFLIGILLYLAAFQPNIEQTLSTQVWLKASYAFAPAGAFLLGGLILLAYPLSRKNQQIISKALQKNISQQKNS